MPDLTTRPDGFVPYGLLPAALPPLRKHINAWLEYKTNKLTSATMRGYRSGMRRFENYFPTTELESFEPPAGTVLIEDFLIFCWSQRSGKTYNKILSILRGFFDWHVRRGNLKQNPTDNIEEAREEVFQRTMFTEDECARILAANYGPREQIALVLLLFYGLRKGAVRGIQLQDFDHEKRTLTIFTKGQKFQTLPIPDQAIWDLVASLDEPGDHYLIPRQRQRRRTPPDRVRTIAAAWLIAEAREMAARIIDPVCARELADLDSALVAAEHALRRAADTASVQSVRFVDEPISDHALHDLWYKWLARAEVVPKGTTSGRRMHDSRHTSAQRLLDLTGDMRIVQEFLGHANAAVTENYVGRNEERLRRKLDEALGPDLAAHLQARIPNRAPDRRPA